MSPLLSRSAGVLLTLALVPGPAAGQEALSRSLSVLSLPAQAPPVAFEALSRAATIMSLPARRPPANNETVARSFTIETPGISLGVPGPRPGEGTQSPSFGRAAPNPFRSVTRIRYALADPTVVRVKIFDLAGRLVRTLSDGPQVAGEHVVEWEATGADNQRVAAGVYLCRLEVGSLKHTRRMVVLE